MQFGQLLTIWAVRLALLLFFVFACFRISVFGQRYYERAARVIWTFAVIAYLVHVVLAFAFYHSWSHAEAVAHTAERTWEVVGIRWGGGIYFNHLFSVICVVETLWWWLWPNAYRSRDRRIGLLIDVYLVFIIFNASVIFVTGPKRWLCLAGFVILALLGLRRGMAKHPTSLA